MIVKNFFFFVFLFLFFFCFLFFLFNRLFINFVNIDDHFKVVHVILSENKKSFYLFIIDKISRDRNAYKTLCAIWCQLYNLKKHENQPWRSVLLLIKLKVTLLHGCLSGIKSRKISHIYFFKIVYVIQWE